jgi:beta-glucosidase-like glycosyl hydrolase
MESVFGRWLRRDLGFDGLVVCDAMDQLAINEESVLRVFRNVDMIMAPSGPNEERITAVLLQALKDGRIAHRELRDRGERVLRYREWVRGWQDGGRHLAGAGGR